MDYRELLKKYMIYARYGQPYLSSDQYGAHLFTEEEWEEMLTLEIEAEVYELEDEPSVSVWKTDKYQGKYKHVNTSSEKFANSKKV